MRRIASSAKAITGNRPEERVIAGSVNPAKSPAMIISQVRSVVDLFRE
jgi:hypothetical protein